MPGVRTALVLLLSLGAGTPWAQAPTADAPKRPLPSRVPADVLGGVPVEILRGDQAYKSGQPFMALAQYRDAAKKHGTNPDIEVRIGQARMSLNECDDGLASALPHRALVAWTPATSSAAAACFARQGRFGEAVYWQEEAVLLAPQTASYWVMLGIFRTRLGDHQLGQEAFLEAEMLDANNTQLLVAQGAFALDRGDFTVLDEVRERLDATDPRGHPMGLVLGARLELDLGNDDLAMAMGLTVMRRGGTSAIVNAVTIEALRRSGDLDLAERIMNRVNNQAQNSPSLAGARVRVAVDRGRLEEATEALAEAEARKPFDPDVVAAAWYLARARGDAAELARREDQWATVNTSPLRNLDQQIPRGGAR